MSKYLSGQQLKMFKKKKMKTNETFAAAKKKLLRSQ